MWINTENKLPELSKPEYCVSIHVIFKTKKKQREGYYHYDNKAWYAIGPPYFLGIWNRKIDNVSHWRLKK